MIERFAGRYHFLSNFYLCPIVLDGILFPSVEHAFQAAKTTIAGDKERIRRCATPGQAKALGRRVKMVDNWDEIKVGVMYDLLRKKFSVVHLRNLLLATGDDPLVEGNTWHDQNWGSCTCPMHEHMEGKNLLGKVLMKIREELRNEQP